MSVTNEMFSGVAKILVERVGIGRHTQTPVIHLKGDRSSTLCGRPRGEFSLERLRPLIVGGDPNACSECRRLHRGEPAPDGGQPTNDGEVGVATPVVQGVGLDAPFAVFNTQGVPFTEAETVEISRGQAVAAGAAVLIVGGLVGMAI